MNYKWVRTELHWYIRIFCLAVHGFLPHRSVLLRSSKFVILVGQFFLNMEVMNFCVFTLTLPNLRCFEAWNAKWNENGDLRAIMGASNRNNLIRLHDCYIYFYFEHFFFNANVQVLLDFISSDQPKWIDLKYNVVTRFYYDAIYLSQYWQITTKFFNLIPINFSTHSLRTVFAV